MSWSRWLRRWFFGEKPRAISDRQISKNPLREFIYLDEVSLQSLLSSKNGEMTATTSTEVTQSVEAEMRSAARAGAVGIGNVETGSRFQTQNSSTLQTAKKATVQSWFRELDRIPNLPTIETVQQVQPFTNITDMVECDNHSVSICKDDLARGDLVEFRVRLAADPIFHLVTIVSEMKAMAEDYPTMMAGNGGLEQFDELEGISRVLQRLLAGLVPVRAQATDYAVVNVDGIEYVAHVDAIKRLDLEHKPLEIGCVTELDAYWKDIRRVLFSDAEFTMLCRIAKNGLRATWTPVKLADLLERLAPDLSRQIDDAAQIMFDGTQGINQKTEQKSTFSSVLVQYAEAYSTEFERKFDEAEQLAIDKKVAELGHVGQCVSEQTDALKQIGHFLSELTGDEIEPEMGLYLREKAREASGFSHFHVLTNSPVASSDDGDRPARNERILDVEVVAMYW